MCYQNNLAHSGYFV